MGDQIYGVDVGWGIRSMGWLWDEGSDLWGGGDQICGVGVGCGGIRSMGGQLWGECGVQGIRSMGWGIRSMGWVWGEGKGIRSMGWVWGGGSDLWGVGSDLWGGCWVGDLICGVDVG